MQRAKDQTQARIASPIWVRGGPHPPDGDRAAGPVDRRAAGDSSGPHDSPVPSPPPPAPAALQRLQDFLPQAGRAYAARRNADLPGHPHVSRLSPYLRRRMVTEGEVLQATLARHGPDAAAKFIDEVFWRTYWKGWLEQRPAIWHRALAEDAAARAGSAARDIAAAEAGRTGIDCFDHWVQELTTTGYLHNHARMWFASIWIFTLGLPWAAGAAFFLRHLLDGDPASNTLSWRWVAGAAHAGQDHLARADNIESFTGGRFRPTGLARSAPPLTEAPPARPQAAARGRAARRLAGSGPDHHGRGPEPRVDLGPRRATCGHRCPSATAQPRCRRDGVGGSRHRRQRARHGATCPCWTGSPICSPGRATAG